MIYKFTIPYEIPSLNLWGRWHWSKRSRVRKVYELEILAQKQEYKYNSGHFQFSNDTILVDENVFPIKKCSIIVKSYRHSLIRDADNRILKGLLDALVNQGIIIDDNEDVIGVPEYLQFVDRGNRRTEIYITRADE